MSNKWKYEVEKVEETLSAEKAERRDKKDIEFVATTNHVGKLKKKKMARPPRKKTAPKGFIKDKRHTIIGYGAALGLSDEEYQSFIKTGKF